MTWIELTREYFRNASDDECDFILWNFTAFPFAKEETIRAHLLELLIKGPRECHLMAHGPKLLNLPGGGEQ